MALNVVALVSGGKDSFFSILHCLASGHQVVALANLHPPVEDVADMESYMYQTIGHSIVPLYEQALGLPSGQYDVPLLLSAKVYNSDGTLNYDTNNNFGLWGDVIEV